MSLNKPWIVVPPPPVRFTQSEWVLHSKQRYRAVEDQQNLAERIINESARVREQTQDATKLNKADVDRELDLRIKDIEFLTAEVEAQRKKSCLEEETLMNYKERIENAIDALKENALKIVKKCIIFREGRIGIDLCTDEVNKQLLKEADVIEGALSLFGRTLEQVWEQIRLLRASKYYLDRDHEDKSVALNIDKSCAALAETSLALSLYHGTSPLDAGNVTGEEWAEISRRSIDRAAQEIGNSTTLRTYVDALMKQVVEDLWDQYYITKTAFEKRIQQTRDVKDKLENEHHEICVKVNDMRENIVQLEKALSEKEGFMGLTHTRLGKRAQRPNVELCRDEVEDHLMYEMKELHSNVGQLQQMLAEAYASLRYLLKSQIQLEEDLNVKTNTLKIDEVDCMTLRVSMDYHSY